MRKWTINSVVSIIVAGLLALLGVLNKHEFVIMMYLYWITFNQYDIMKEKA